MILIYLIKETIDEINRPRKYYDTRFFDIFVMVLCFFPTLVIDIMLSPFEIVTLIIYIIITRKEKKDE